jgi:hypothetical protein
MNEDLGQSPDVTGVIRVANVDPAPGELRAGLGVRYHPLSGVPATALGGFDSPGYAVPVGLLIMA